MEGHTDWVRDVAWAPNVGLPRTYLASASQVCLFIFLRVISEMLNGLESNRTRLSLFTLTILHPTQRKLGPKSTSTLNLQAMVKDRLSQIPFIACLGRSVEPFWLSLVGMEGSLCGRRTSRVNSSWSAILIGRV